MSTTTDPPPQSYEPHPDPKSTTPHNVTDVDYTPHPSSSVPTNPEQKHIVDSICRLYSGSASEEDMQVYAEKAVYDDPWSYCDTRYKIAGQWWGIPKIFKTSKTLETEVIKADKDEIVFKLRQEYTPKVLRMSKPVDSLVSLSLDERGKVKYHKDMWNEKDYSHEGLGKVMKTLNGDYLTGVTKPPEGL